MLAKRVTGCDVQLQDAARSAAAFAEVHERAVRGMMAKHGEAAAALAQKNTAQIATQLVEAGVVEQQFEAAHVKAVAAAAEVHDAALADVQSQLERSRSNHQVEVGQLESELDTQLDQFTVQEEGYQSQLISMQAQLDDYEGTIANLVANYHAAASHQERTAAGTVSSVLEFTPSQPSDLPETELGLGRPTSAEAVAAQDGSPVIRSPRMSAGSPDVFGRSRSIERSRSPSWDPPPRATSKSHARPPELRFHSQVATGSEDGPVADNATGNIGLDSPPATVKQQQRGPMHSDCGDQLVITTAQSHAAVVKVTVVPPVVPSPVRETVVRAAIKLERSGHAQTAADRPGAKLPPTRKVAAKLISAAAVGHSSPAAAKPVQMSNSRSPSPSLLERRLGAKRLAAREAEELASFRLSTVALQAALDEAKTKLSRTEALLAAARIELAEARLRGRALGAEAAAVAPPVVNFWDGQPGFGEHFGEFDNQAYAYMCLGDFDTQEQL